MAASDEEENYWPGYVDALTTMTMVLTFIMLVLGLAVFSLSQNVSKGFLETIAKAMNISDSLPKDITSDELAKVMLEHIEKQDAEHQSAQKQVAAFTAHNGGRMVEATLGTSTTEKRIESAAEAAAGASAQAIDVKKTLANLRLVYKARATSLDEAARGELNSAFAAGSTLRDAPVIEIVAGVDKASPAVTDGNRVSYYRALGVRGQLIDAGIAPERLRVRLDPSLSGTEVLISGAN
jgi:hypothetical protein